VNNIIIIVFSAVNTGANSITNTNSKQPTETPGGWLNGYYKIDVDRGSIVHVDGDRVTDHKLKWQESKEDGRIKFVWEKGPNNTVKMTWNNTGHCFAITTIEIYPLQCVEYGIPDGTSIKSTGHVSSDKKNISVRVDSPEYLNHFKFVLEWITPEEAGAITKRDPVEAPPGNYKIHPEKEGKIVWLSGPPGSGKSTIAALMSKMAGYVYYEGDAFIAGVNPYPPDAKESSLQTNHQPILFGKGLKRRKEIVDKYIDKNIHHQQNDEAKMDYYRAQAEDIVKEKKRIGGSFAVAKGGVPDRKTRDFFRKHLGDDAVVVVLDLDEELLKERLAKRHKNHQEVANRLIKFAKFYEPVQEGERNAINFWIEKGKTAEENAKKLLELVNEWAGRVE